MRHLYLRISLALLTLIIGVSATLSCRTIKMHQSQLEREEVLRDELFKLRSLIDQYAADRSSLPKSLDDLVKDGYLRELPTDPFTGQKDWVVTMGTEPNSSENQQGVTDVHSASWPSRAQARRIKSGNHLRA